jgi:hypothetical protein
MSIEDRTDFDRFADVVEDNSDMARTAATKKSPATAMGVPEAQALVRALTDVGFDEAAFMTIINQMNQRAYDKQRVIEVAALYLGRSAHLFKTKPAALRAMLDAFRQRSYAKARNQLNAKVTPF